MTIINLKTNLTSCYRQSAMTTNRGTRQLQNYRQPTTSLDVIPAALAVVTLAELISRIMCNSVPWVTFVLSWGSLVILTVMVALLALIALRCIALHCGLEQTRIDT